MGDAPPLFKINPFLTSNVSVGVPVQIPTLPLPVTNNILFTAGESISYRAEPDEPEIWRDADGFLPAPRDKLWFFPTNRAVSK